MTTSQNNWNKKRGGYTFLASRILLCDQWQTKVYPKYVLYVLKINKTQALVTVKQ